MQRVSCGALCSVFFVADTRVIAFTYDGIKIFSFDLSKSCPIFAV